MRDKITPRSNMPLVILSLISGNVSITVVMSIQIWGLRLSTKKHCMPFEPFEAKQCRSSGDRSSTIYRWGLGMVTTHQPCTWCWAHPHMWSAMGGDIWWMVILRWLWNWDALREVEPWDCAPLLFKGTSKGAQAFSQWAQIS